MRDRARRALFSTARIAAPVGVFLLAIPVSKSSLRLALLASVAILWLAAVVRLWPARRARIAWLSATFLVTACLFGPGRDADPDELTRSYVRALRRYEGTRYVWGGEGRLGVDCSGLLRRARMDAELSVGIRSANPRLLRAAVARWWFDQSARAMLQGERGQTTVVAAAKSIRVLDLGSLRAGDLAVTSDGVHVLAYLGAGEWIEADPIVGRVIRLDVATSDNEWLDVPVVHIRWR